MVKINGEIAGESFSKISLTKGSIASVNKVDGRTVVFAYMFGKPGSSGSPVIDIDSKKVIGIFWGEFQSLNMEKKLIALLLVILFGIH